MKVLVVLLLCSLAANAALFLRSRSGSGDGPATMQSNQVEVATAAQSSRAEAERQAVAVLFDATKTDGATLKARLEAMGFPPEVVRAAIREQLRHVYQTKQRALAGNTEPKPFWETGTAPLGTINANAENQRAMNDLRKELRAQTIALLGTEMEINETNLMSLQQYWGRLPEEKIQAVMRIENDYSELQRDLRVGRTSSSLTPAEQEQLNLLQREQRTDLAAALTPDELFEYDLRRSSTASRLRSQLQGFDATEEEYRALFKLHQALDQASGRDLTSRVTPSTSSSRAEDRAAFLSQVKQVLTPERYNDFEFASNPSHGTLVRITTRLGLPMQAARDVAEARTDSLQAVSRVRGNTALSPAERNAELASIAQAANERVSRALGDEGRQAYIEHGGSWLSTLHSSPARAPAPAP